MLLPIGAESVLGSSLDPWLDAPKLECESRLRVGADIRLQRVPRRRDVRGQGWRSRLC